MLFVHSVHLATGCANRTRRLASCSNNPSPLLHTLLVPECFRGIAIKIIPKFTQTGLPWMGEAELTLHSQNVAHHENKMYFVTTCAAQRELVM